MKIVRSKVNLNSFTTVKKLLLYSLAFLEMPMGIIYVVWNLAPVLGRSEYSHDSQPLLALS